MRLVTKTWIGSMSWKVGISLMTSLAPPLRYEQRGAALKAVFGKLFQRCECFYLQQQMSVEDPGAFAGVINE